MTCKYCNGTGKYKKPNDKVVYEEIDYSYCSNVEK